MPIARRNQASRKYSLGAGSGWLITRRVVSEPFWHIVISKNQFQNRRYNN